MKPVIKDTGGLRAFYKGYRMPWSLLKRILAASEPVIEATGWVPLSSYYKDHMGAWKPVIKNTGVDLETLNTILSKTNHIWATT